MSKAVLLVFPFIAVLIGKPVCVYVTSTVYMSSNLALHPLASLALYFACDCMHTRVFASAFAA